MTKMLTILSLIITASSAFANTLVCTPTISAGNINYRTEGIGLNRISKVTVKTNSSGKLILNFEGTAGVGDQAANATQTLSWASSYGDELHQYDNAATSKSTLAKPYIRFEMENAFNSKSFLTALTFSAANDVKSPVIYTSRFNCVVE